MTLSEKYIAIYNAALSEYQSFGKPDKRKNRPGYPDGFFTRWRHSFKPYPHIQNLYDHLLEADDDDSKSILINYFKDPKTTYHNHSFSASLLKYLQLHDPDYDWKSHDPKPVVFYRHNPERHLFRGTDQPYTEVFEKGFVENYPSNYIESYARCFNFKTGISTSYSFRVAQKFASKHAGMSMRYIYEINLRNQSGIDICASLSGRKISPWLQWFAQPEEQEEINVIHEIPTEDIVGVYYVLLDDKNYRFLANPHYKENRPIKELPAEERIQEIFGKKTL